MLATDGDVREAVEACGGRRLDVVLSLWPIPGGLRDSLRSRNVMWIDIANKEQSRISNDLGDEVSSFLKRYGVRTARHPRIPSGFKREDAFECPSRVRS
jgi:hypothetical protein